MGDSAIIAHKAALPGESYREPEAEITDISPFAGLIWPSLFQQQEQPEQVSPTKGSSAPQWLSATLPLLQQGFGIQGQSLNNVPKVTPAAWCPKPARWTMREGTGW